jgi:hypothetical protein
MTNLDLDAIRLRAFEWAGLISQRRKADYTGEQ